MSVWPPEVPPWRPLPVPPGPDRPERPRPPVPMVSPPEPPAGGGYADRVRDELLLRRIVLLSGELTHDAATTAAAQVMLLDADGDDDIRLHVGCPDGDLEASLMLAETVDLAASLVVATATGAVGGPAVAVFAAAGRRLAHPHASFRLAEPRVRLEGRAQEVAAQAAHHEDLLARLHDRIARATGRPVAEVAADMRAGRILRADDAVGYGLVHEVLSRH